MSKLVRDVMHSQRINRLATILILLALVLASPMSARATAYDAAVTLTTTVEVADLSKDEIWLAGLVTQPDEAGSVAFGLRWRKETTSWFPTWSLELTSEKNLLPGGASTLELARTAPVPGAYDVTISYSAALNALSVRVHNSSRNQLVYAGGFEVAPHDGALYALTGTTTPYYTPAGATWAPGVLLTSGAFIALSQFDDVNEDARIRLATPGPLPPGEFRFYLESSGERQLLASVRPEGEENWVFVPLAELPIGPSTIRAEYIDNDVVVLSDARTITIGRVDFWIPPLLIDRDAGVVRVELEARSPGSVEGVIDVTIAASVYELVWDSARRDFSEVPYVEDVPLFAGELDLGAGTERIAFDLPIPDRQGNWRLELAANVAPVVPHTLGPDNRLFSTHRPATIEPGETYTFVVFPDTQLFAQREPHIFTRMTDWVTANADEINIVAVLHMGDITNNNAPTEWENAFSSMSLLHGVVPYVLTVGNHDMTLGGGGVDRRGLSRINTYFPVELVQRYTNLAGTMTPGRLENHYSLFSLPDADYLVISLEFGPPDEAIDWANRVADQYPDHRLIFITHAYLTRNGGQGTSAATYPLAENPETTVNTAPQIWNKLLRSRANSFMVLSGHTSPDVPVIPYRVGTTTGGRPVFELLFDYQNQPNGGDGWLGILAFHPDNTMEGWVYSPYLGKYSDAVAANGYTAHIIADLATGSVRRLSD